MATVPITLRPAPDRTWLRVSWEGFAANNDVGTAVDHQRYRDRSVQVLGSFGTGLEITVQGSNDNGTTWATLKDAQGNNVVFTAAGLKDISAVTQKIRPAATAGSGGDADVYIFFAGNDS